MAYYQLMYKPLKQIQLSKKEKKQYINLTEEP